MNSDFCGYQAVLWDLDGTLLDSAPDLAHAANALRHRRGLLPLPLPQLRPHVGQGARGMLAVTLGVEPANAEFEALREEFLTLYEHCMGRYSQRFAGVDATLAALQDAGLRWGIVTNKHARFAQPIVAADAVLTCAAVLVCGDSVPQPKPHPASLLHAAAALGVAPAQCVYVGDDVRDMQAARAAGMGAVAAAWGYLGVGQRPQDWGADAVLEQPQHILELVRGRL